MLQRAAAGELDALVVGGVEIQDLDDPWAARSAIEKAGFVVSLEVRESAVTQLADVVLPVAPVVEKSGSFVNWEGRVRPFAKVLTESNALPDVRVLAGIAEELGRPLGFRTPAAAAAELDELGVWDGERSAGPVASTPHTSGSPAGEAGFRLATWKPMIGDGPMQDGDPAYRASAPVPTILVSSATHRRLHLTERPHVAVSTAKGSVHLPVDVADLDDDVVFVPNGTAGINVARDLGAGPGSIVQVAPAHVELDLAAGAEGDR
jgi:NADH-quinone oxidoreductase subunit G